MSSIDDRSSSPSNFIREIIESDLASGKHDTVVTRFPPEPNGYLHIGHAKSIVLNSGVAQDYGGRFHLRFDDTNPVKEDVEYVESIKNDVRWLGADWRDHLYFASDYFERMYELAVDLIRRGKAYVDSSTREEIRELRGDFHTPGRNSPYRERTVEQNLDLFRRMRAGEFPDGAHVLRAKIDMAASNILMRDPLLYRIMHAHHHRTGDDWCIYPMYDYAHALEDAFEGVTHSLCTLEFEINRELYDWVIRETKVPHVPRQIEFARLALDYTVMSKRKLLRLVESGVVSGWDDPRMPTLAGMRRRGYTPEAIRAFCDMIGVAKTNSIVDIGKLEYAIRDDLNHRAPRVMAVLDPLEVTITNYPDGETELLDADYWPHDVPKEGSRKVPFSKTIYIERGDFHEDPPKGYHRLAPGREVRLRYAYFIRCDEVVRDDAGEIVGLRCTYDPATRGGNAPDGRKVKGTIHWVDAASSVPVEVRLYDRLFSAPNPEADPDREFTEFLNPDSLEVVAEARVEPSVIESPQGPHYQFERLGYFVVDSADSRPDAPVFNRVVALKDSWARRTVDVAAEAEALTAARRRKKVERSEPKPPSEPRVGERELAREADATLAARYRAYIDDLGLDESDADLLTPDHALADFFDAARAAYADAREVAKWVVNEVLRELKDRPLADLPFGGTELGKLVALVAADTISSTAAKEVFAEMVANGGTPAAIVEARGLRQVTDADALGAVVDQVIAAHADEAERFRAGEKKLLGFFIGQVMRASGGKANPQVARELVTERLG